VVQECPLEQDTTASGVVAAAVRACRAATGSFDCVRRKQRTGNLNALLGINPVPSRTDEGRNTIPMVFDQLRRAAPPGARVIALSDPHLFPSGPTDACGLGAGAGARVTVTLPGRVRGAERHGRGRPTTPSARQSTSCSSTASSGPAAQDDAVVSSAVRRPYAAGRDR